MFDLRRLVADTIAIIIIVAVVFGMYWTYSRYQEFVVMRTVVAAVACSQPTEAAKLGISCGPAQPPTAAPATPASTEKPGDDKKPAPKE